MFDEKLRDSAAERVWEDWKLMRDDLGGEPAMFSDALMGKLRKLVNQLDLSPRDGVLSIAEIERGLHNPPIDSSALDMALLRLLKRYYALLKELSDDEYGPDSGISRRDLDVLQRVFERTLIAEKN